MTRSFLRMLVERQLIPAIVSIVAVLSVTGSGWAQPASDSVIVGYPSPALTELPNYVAVKKGFYTAEKLDIKFVRARSNILVAALVGGSVDYITSITSSIGGIVGGAPLKILAGVIKNNPDFLMA